MIVITVVSYVVDTNIKPMIANDTNITPTIDDMYSDNINKIILTLSALSTYVLLI